MKWLVAALIFFIPPIVLAACSAEGYTVIYVNGILTEQKDAQQDSTLLGRKLGNTYQGQPLNVYNGYNPSHLGGLGDLLQARKQAYGDSASDFALNTILMQIAPQVTTRKVLLVGP